MIISFTIGRPFSANRMYQRQMTKKGRRNLTPEYRAWRDEMGWEAKRQTVGAPTITGPYDMTIVLPPTRMDSDNVVKTIGDLCQNIGLVSNDRNLQGITVQHADRQGCFVVLTPLTTQPETPAKPMRKRASKPRDARATPSQIRKAHRVGVWAKP